MPAWPELPRPQTIAKRGAVACSVAASPVYASGVAASSLAQASGIASMSWRIQLGCEVTSVAPRHAAILTRGAMSARETPATRDRNFGGTSWISGISLARSFW